MPSAPTMRLVASHKDLEEVPAAAAATAVPTRPATAAGDALAGAA